MKTLIHTHKPELTIRTQNQKHLVTLSSSNLFLWASSTSLLAEGKAWGELGVGSSGGSGFFSVFLRAASFSLAARIEGLRTKRTIQVCFRIVSYVATWHHRHQRISWNCPFLWGEFPELVVSLQAPVLSLSGFACRFQLAVREVICSNDTVGATYVCTYLS